MSHRKPPLSERRGGFCRWCDQPIEPRLKRDGTLHKVQPSMHRECSREYWQAMNPLRFYEALLERDGAGCQECRWGEGRRGYQCEVDHKIPLWKVAELPDVKRREYFRLGNLWLLCSACHKRKSAKEAAERAHLKRLTREKKQPGSKLQSRPFDKRLRKKFDGTVEARE